MRVWSTYEFNHLVKFGFDPFSLPKTVDVNIPVEYISGKCEFRGLTFNVNQNVLIPRVETEQLVDLALAEIEKLYEEFHQKIWFADVGTGSGCIGLSLAFTLLQKDIPFTGVLSDVSQGALDVSIQNAKDLELPILDDFQSENSGLVFVRSDLLTSYPKDLELDFILANLPYIPSARVDSLDKSVKNYEPKLALDGGKDGLTLIKKLLEQAKLYLNPLGRILLEVDDMHIDPSFAQDFDVKLINDVNGKNRFWVMAQK